jgi:aspartate/methionine/tyrosine aminotransferase
MPIEIESPEQMGYGNIECNLAESSVTDAVLKDLDLNINDLVLCYGHHVGKPELCELIAKEAGVNAGDVLLTAGAAAALFIVNTSLLSKDDHIIVAHPNYSTNIETPRTIGCEIDLLHLEFENGFRIDIEKLRSLIKPSTKLISLTTPHNPTGVMMKREDLDAVIKLAEEKNIYVMIDETYRDLAFGERLPVAASLSDKVITVSSVSKAYGLPGIRLGWLICRDKQLVETFLAAKEQIYICNSVADEEIAYKFLLKKDEYFTKTKKNIEQNYKILYDWLHRQREIEFVLPEGGVVCFPRIRKQSNIDIEKFYRILNERYSTYVGPGHWFEMDKSYMRIGFGWPKAKEFRKGLENISLSLKEAQ